MGAKGKQLFIEKVKVVATILVIHRNFLLLLGRFYPLFHNKNGKIHDKATDKKTYIKNKS
jgi:hypothetical protein